jgi:hypothetical protein
VVERLDTPVARVQSARWAGLAVAAVRLVTARTVMVRQRRPRRDRTRRVMRFAESLAVGGSHGRPTVTGDPV